MSGDVVARARELMRDVEGYGDWILEPNEDSNGAYHVHSSSGSCIAEFSDRGDARFAATARSLVPELIEELEMQTSLQGLSVQIPEYGEWGSETLLCLFQDFGIQPGDGYQEVSSRQGDLLRALAAANAEVEQLRGALETIRGHCIDLGRPLHHIIGDILALTDQVERS